LDRVSTETR